MRGEINHPDDENLGALCAICAKPAACAGRYEDDTNPIAFACDECCGHGNEDGWCVRIEDLDGWMETVDRAASQLREENDRLQAVIRAEVNNESLTDLEHYQAHIVRQSRLIAALRGARDELAAICDGHVVGPGRGDRIEPITEDILGATVTVTPFKDWSRVQELRKVGVE